MSEFAQRGEAAVDFEQLDKKSAFELIKGGSPGNKPRKGLARNAQARADAVRPNGLLMEMYDAWRFSGAASDSKFDKVDALQLDGGTPQLFVNSAFNFANVPEPSTGLLVSTGLLGLSVFGRRRKS